MTLRGMVRAVAAVWLLFGVANPAAAEWRRAESPNFITFGEGDEARLRAQVTVLEDYATLLRAMTNVPPDSPAAKLRVYLVRGNDDLRRVPPLSGIVPGFYVASPAGIAAFVNADAPSSSEVLFHEYAHHYMMQYHGVAYPPWYVEGFAEYLGPTRFTDRHIEIGRVNGIRSSWLFERASWLPTESVMFSPAAVTDVEQTSRFYAQSWLITHYLFSDVTRRSQLIRYLEALNRGEEGPAAFRASFGIVPDEMHRRLVRYSRDGIVYRRLDRSSVNHPVEIAVTTLPPSADRLLMADAAMRIGRKVEPEELARIRREAGRLNDPFARRVLARAEALHGDGAAAEQLLTELLAAAPSDSELLYLRGMRHIVAARTLAGAERSAQYRQARTWLGRAHRADRTDFATLYRYVQTYSGDPELTSENNLNVLLLAHQLAPQVDEVRINAATMLLARGDFERSEMLLRPLASSAHGENAANQIARTLLGQARARSAEGVELVFDREGKVQ